MTSAVHTRHGVYAYDQRLAQTQDTIASIRRHAPGAQVLLLECSAEPLRPETKALLRSLVDLYIDLPQDADVASIYAVENHDVVKNLTELTCMVKFLAYAVETQRLAGLQRLIKLSGRYQLTDAFTLDMHNHPGRYVLKAAQASQFAPEVTGGIGFQHMCRQWSVGVPMMAHAWRLFDSMREDMRVQLRAGRYLDVEHLLFKFLGEHEKVEVTRIGVRGWLGPNGMPVED